MPVSAYQIGIDFVSDASKVVGPGSALLSILEKIQSAQRATQMGFNEMASALRGATRTASTLADVMERVAKAATAAASATSRIKPPSGGGYASDGVGGTTTSRASPGSAAASSMPGSQGQIGYFPPVFLAPPNRAVSAATSSGAIAAPGTALAVSGGGGSSMPPLNIGQLPGGGGGAGGSAGGRFRLPSLPAMGPYGKMLGGYLGVHTVKDAYEQGADVNDTLAKMAAIQVRGADGRPTAAFTPAQIQQAQNQAMATMRRVPGLGYGQGLDVILQTAGLLGNSSKALELAPQLSFNAQVLSRYGKGDAIGQVEKAVQAGELTGLTGKDGQIDVPRLVDFVNRLTRTTVAMGGQLDIGKYLTGIRQFGLGAEAADLDFTTATLPAYMKIMGEAKAGTALTSLQQVLLAP
ncbi:MAG: hypothetical protein ACRYHQ_31595, partial [Janthinobacterium lividum]